jgi:hypothetical protein
VSGALLMFHSNPANAERMQYIEYLEVSSSRVAEDDINTFELQATCKNLGTSQGTFSLFLSNLAKQTAGDS